MGIYLSSVIRQKSKSQNGYYKKQSTPNIPGMLSFRVTPVLRFALLHIADVIFHSRSLIYLFIYYSFILFIITIISDSLLRIWFCPLTWGISMKIGHFCLFRIIPVISHLIPILLIAFILASSSNFNDLFDFESWTNFNKEFKDWKRLLFVC